MTLMTSRRTHCAKSLGKGPIKNGDDRHGSPTSPQQKRSRVDSARHFPKFCGPIDVATLTQVRIVLPDDCQGQTDDLEDSKKILYEAMKLAKADRNWGTFRNNLPKDSMLSKETSIGDDGNYSDEDDCVIVGLNSIDISNGKSLANDDTGSNQCALRPSVPEILCQHDQGETSKRWEFEFEVDEKYDDNNEEDICLLSSLEWKNIMQKKSVKGADPSQSYSEQKNLGKMRMRGTGVEELKAITSYDAAVQNFSRKKVEEVLKLYQDKMQSIKATGKWNGARSALMPTKAVMMLKKENKWLNIQPTFGHIPGVQIGDQFQFRAELVMLGLHHEFIRGINCTVMNGTIYAVSVVDSGRYENKAKSSNVLVYSGEGGNLKVQTKQQEGDQKLEGGNLGLKNTMDSKFPVRVIRKIQRKSAKQFYMYDGLYKVNRYWPEISVTGLKTYKFEMIRMSDQSKPIKSFDDFRVVISEDLSQGKEKVEIMVVNDISDEKPTSFTYITKIISPFLHEPSVLNGCDCIGGCSDSYQCPCVVKNNGEVPFNEDGGLLETKDMIYECGPNCKCPSSCHNRVSQHGLKIPLEVFKTKSTGWGVRSRQDVKSGSFICEYIGELVEDKEADHCVNDEYLFDLGDGNGFTIDAAKCGNVSRFINHSCSPNLHAQNVLYDHVDERLPHVMLFATEDIPALVELTYDYNYEIGSVCYPDGNIKEKKCFCGSPSCTGRLY